MLAGRDFAANEVLSIVENAGLMGVPMPEVIRKAVDILKTNTGSYEDAWCDVTVSAAAIPVRT